MAFGSHVDPALLDSRDFVLAAVQTRGTVLARATERLRANRTLSAALGAITAAVFGVVLNLAFWFAVHVLFSETRTVTGFGLDMEVPVPGSVAAVLAVAALVAVFALRLSLFVVLGGAAAAGLLAQFAGIV